MYYLGAGLEEEEDFSSSNLLSNSGSILIELRCEKKEAKYRKEILLMVSILQPL